MGSKLNGHLNRARTRKLANDEFYTKLEDIEEELKHYKSHFKDKVIYCNCDDSSESNFSKYFSDNFKTLGIKRLIVNGFNVNKDLKNNYYKIWISETNISKGESDGDFRGKESIEFLKKADIVVTNPPFSIFKEHITQVLEYNKKFIIIGDLMKATNKEIFNLINRNKLSIGYNYGNKIFKEIANICWFTNIKIKKYYKDLKLTEKYSEIKHLKYDNYDAISVDKVKDIPADYKGVMGVPMTFLFKHNPHQFDILGKTNDSLNSGKYLTSKSTVRVVNGTRKFHRILIRNKRL